jgi:hydroxymethylpyrimidine/phosphomethylpyrimidine kinase
MDKIALTIAGSDPSGGAGLQADLKTFHSLEVYGISVPSVLTSQSSEGVHSIHEIPPDFFRSQMDVLLQDIKPDALKTGMIYSNEFIQIIAEKIKVYSLNNLVIDPVTVSSTGVMLIEEGVMDELKQHLFPLAKVITPNTYEAAVLTGIEIVNEKDIKDAAVKLRESGPETVIITGGHLHGNAEDLLFDGDDFLTLENDRLEGEFHGTGCVFSSAITACLARGYDVKESFIKAKEVVWNAMKLAVSVGEGMKVLNV